MRSTPATTTCATAATSAASSPSEPVTPLQHAGDELVGEGAGNRRPGQRAVDNRAAERVEGGVHVEVGRQLAGGDAAAEHRALGLAPGVEVALVEDARRLRVVLGLADQRQQHPARPLLGE